jgi:alpha-D-xyloside xylohydrolase
MDRAVDQHGWVVFFAVAICACSPAPDSEYFAQAEIRAGDYRLVIDERPRVRLLRVDDELVRFEADGFRLGLAAPVDDAVNYDPYRLWVPTALYVPPVEPTFVTARAARFAGGSEQEIRLTLEYDGGRAATLVARAPGNGRFALTLTPTTGASEVAYLGLRAKADDREGWYGMGEVNDDVNQRGKVRAMQLELDTSTEAGYNDAHAPIPLVIGTRGWGLFVETRLPGAFSLGKEQPDRIDAVFAPGTRASVGIPFHLFGAGHPLDIPKRYFDVTGTPGLPARWALGPWVWRDENEDQAQVEKDLDAIRDLDLATTGYWIDRPYATGVNTFDFEKARFPSPQAMIAKMHALGFRTALWHTPYLDENDPSTKALRDEATAKGYYPKKRGLSLNKWGPILDLTSAEVKSWWRDRLRAYTDMGIEGFKLDYAEDVVISPNAKRLAWEFADGSDERTAHSTMQLHYHGTYAPLLPKDGGFLLTRAARWGDQVHGMIMWPGDLDSSFAKQGEMVSEKGEKYVATGGLPASLINGLTLATVGYPFYGADTGGYRHCPPDNELFSRWFEQTALSSTMQIGTSCNDVAWEPTAKNGFDAAMLERYRSYVRLHLRLFPYLWSHAVRIEQDGRPLMRALGFAHPELGVHPNDIYLLGDELLVAPVVERGKTSRKVIFPAGRWIHWFTGEAIDSKDPLGVEREIAAPLGRLPLFMRAGGLVPMLRPTIDTLSPTTDPKRVDSYATAPGLVYVRGVARHSASFALYDGGKLAETTQSSATTLSFTAGSELVSGAIFELLAADAPANVAAGADLVKQIDLAAVESSGGWYYDGSSKTLWLRVTAGKPVVVTWP